MCIMFQRSEMAKRFVCCPGIIDIIWTSDDPEFYHPPSDLFDVQSHGLDDVENFLKRDKGTTEQAMEQVLAVLLKYLTAATSG